MSAPRAVAAALASLIAVACLAMPPKQVSVPLSPSQSVLKLMSAGANLQEEGGRRKEGWMDEWLESDTWNA